MDSKDTSQKQSDKGTNNSFLKGMAKDYNDTFVGEGVWTHARNIVNNSNDGQLGVVGNEPSTFLCIQFPYAGATIIGATHTTDDNWVIFSTNDINSEIGLFDESQCSYKTLVNDPCLAFKKTNLITATNRAKYNCGTLVYWDDGLNPTRSMDIENIPWIQICTTVNGCTTCVDTTVLNCERIRIAPHIVHPCINIERGTTAGTLPNGSYQACIAYTINQLKVTDYLGLSEVQGLFTHENTSSSLIITINNIDTTFDEFELVLLTNINAQTVAKRIGFYNTSQGSIYVDRWDPEYVTIPVSSIIQRTEPIEKSDALYSVGDYLMRTGIYNKFKFNYQPLANQIRVNWVCTEYPQDYYIKSNNNVGYLRDEQYAFFIRFVYNTGEFSDSYHIPGRPSLPADTVNVAGGDAYESFPIQYWQVQNTASVTASPLSIPTLDGGIIIAKGGMAYWESTERYPSNKPDIWNSFPNIPGSPLNLCGQQIRHHKMPDETVDPILNLFNSGASRVRLLGVEFNNIMCPLDNYGNPIESVVGYEILRGSREGNKTILAKGLINNMREYNIPGNTVKGLLQNYPYNDLRDDVYLTSNGNVSKNGENGVKTVTQSNSPKLNVIKQDIFTFHSPDVSFSNPFLNPNEIKVYQLMTGKSNGSFEIPYKHPKFKTLSNFSAIISRIGSLLLVAKVAYDIVAAASTAAGGGINTLPVVLAATDDLPFNNTLTAPLINSFGTGIFAFGSGTIVGNPAIAAKNSATTIYNLAVEAAFIIFTVPVLNEQITKIITALVPKRQNALQYISHGFYDNSISNQIGNRRRSILQSYYLGSNIQQFTNNYQVNNLNRNKVVILKTNSIINNPIVQDNSRFLYSETDETISKNVQKDISSYYASLKIPMPSQYGQLEQIKQIPISTCVNPITPNKSLRFSTQTLFGGDIYINRFTEKNTMLFFSDWLMGQPDLYEYDYTKVINVPYPRFWINNTEKHSFFRLADDYRALDARESSTFFVNQGYFYLFNSGVRDFFCESEVNVAYRDWEEEVPKRFYDPNLFTDLNAMFRSDIIRSGEYYKYDYSLSTSKLLGSHITWGNTLPRDYDPEVAENCYTYTPNRVIYSLPLKDESPKQDGWSIFRINNKKDFISPVSSIKAINKTGAIFMMKNMSPLSFMGVEELKLDGTGAKITIGDGKLFETGQNQLQSLVNTEESYEYGSNQSNYSAVNTTYGLFWVSQAAGKVFTYGGSGLEEISKSGMRWWFFKYLPSELLKVFPDYALYDNAVIGIGTQIMFDSTYEILYVTKKDYKPKYPVGNGLDQIYLSPIDLTTFTFNGTSIQLTDTRYFEDASWTISYDPKLKAWLSFHDWKPTFMFPGRNHFMSVAKSTGSTKDTIWKHNIRCDSYCNFYGINYPFEIEFVSSTGQGVTTMRSIEYLLEVYTIHNDCRDKFHVIDQNFDQAIIYNSEQISGVLQLVLKGKNDPLGMLAYPQINPNSISIQFSKEEHKYRFNQFWDITKNRGEFPPGFNLPMFTTASNGYEYPINPLYVNYNKSILERKKFRHQVNKVFLRRVNSGSYKFLFKISNQKLLQSLR